MPCSEASNRRKFPPLLLLFAVFLVLFPTNFTRAQTTSSEALRIESIDAFWGAAQTEELKAQRLELDLEFQVTFYDPIWHVLYVYEAQKDNYLAVASKPLPFQTGDRVHVTGYVIPEIGLESDAVSVEILEPQELPQPQPYDRSLVKSDNPYSITYSTLTGYIQHGFVYDPHHYGYDLVVDNYQVSVFVKHEPKATIPNLVGKFVQFEGIFDSSTQGEKQTGRAQSLWVDNFDKLQFATETNKRFSKSRTRISELERASRNEPVILSGLVYDQEVGEVLVIKDETGLITIRTEQRVPLNIGDPISVSGYPIQSPSGWTLRDAVYFSDSTIDESIRSEITIHYQLVEQILKLRKPEFRKNHTASITGTITYLAPDKSYAYLQDQSGGIRIDFDQSSLPTPQKGNLVQVDGNIAPGDFAPRIQVSNYNVIANSEPPEPVWTSIDIINTGSLDGHWVRVAGHVKSTQKSEGHIDALLSTRHGELNLRLDQSSIPPQLAIGSQVVADGVLVSQSDHQNRLFRVSLLVSGADDLQLDDSPLSSPFSLPTSDLGELFQYQPPHTVDNHIKIRGIVSHVRGNTLFVTNGDHTLRVVAQTIPELRHDQEIEAVGLLQKNLTNTYLRDATIRKTGFEKPLLPTEIDLANLAIRPEFNGKLVTFDATLIDKSVSDTETQFILQEGAQYITAIGNKSLFLPISQSLKPKSRLKITGVYFLTFNEDRQPEEAAIHLRSPDDITVLRPAPWWTLEKILYAFFATFLAVIFVGVWTLQLRKRVRKQTKLLRDKIEQENILQTVNREIVSNAHDFVYTIDFEGRFLTFNEAGLRMTGYTSEETSNLTIYDLLDPPVQRRVKAVLKRAHRTRNAVFEVQIRKKDGSRLWVEASAGFIRIDGEPVCAFGVLHDIDASKQIQFELTRARDTAEETTKAKSDFLATISHEIRTPMNGIIGMSDLLLKHDIAEPVREYGETIHQCAEDLLALINDILDLSKAEAGKLTLESKPFNLAATLHRTVTFLKPNADTKGIELRSKISENIPPLLGDPARIRQITFNLLGNALKFTESGHVSLSARIKKLSSTEATIRIQVSDTGIGIPDEVKPKLFEPFVQAESSHSRRFGGSGLGLKICREIATLMGGEVGFESTQGVGSKFWFVATFPVAHHAQSPRYNSVSPARVTWEDDPIEVLVAEDFPVNQQLIGLQLSSIGLKADIVSNGNEVLDAVSKKSYDVILMDCQMPDLDGFATTERLRQDPEFKDIYIVALTANAMKGDRERCIKAGMNDYISKPTSPEQILESLQAFKEQ